MLYYIIHYWLIMNHLRKARNFGKYISKAGIFTGVTNHLNKYFTRDVFERKKKAMWRRHNSLGYRARDFHLLDEQKRQDHLIICVISNIDFISNEIILLQIHLCILQHQQLSRWCLSVILYTVYDCVIKYIYVSYNAKHILLCFNTCIYSVICHILLLQQERNIFNIFFLF